MAANPASVCGVLTCLVQFRGSGTGQSLNTGARTLFVLRHNLPQRRAWAVSHKLARKALRSTYFDHRKVLIEDRLQQLAAAFGNDLLVFSCLSNHFLLILKSRPDVVATWDDTEVVAGGCCCAWFVSRRMASPRSRTNSR